MSFFLLSGLANAVASALKHLQNLKPCRKVTHFDVTLKCLCGSVTNFSISFCLNTLVRPLSPELQGKVGGKPSNPVNSTSGHPLLGALPALSGHVFLFTSLRAPETFHLITTSLESWKGSGTVTPAIGDECEGYISGRKTRCSRSFCSCCFFKAKFLSSKKRSRPLTTTGFWMSFPGLSG